MSRSHNLSQLIRRPGARVVCMFRGAAAAFHSHFHFLRDRHHPSVEDGNIRAFFESMIESWREHVSCALSFHRESPDRMVLLNYERPQPVTGQQLRMAATFLRIDYTTSMIDAAMARMRGFFWKSSISSPISNINAVAATIGCVIFEKQVIERPTSSAVFFSGNCHFTGVPDRLLFLATGQIQKENRASAPSWSDQGPK